MEIHSHSLIFKDFSTNWYKRWAKELKQDKKHLDNHSLKANKFWQNAVIAQALWERDVLRIGAKAIGFGVGKERLPALFAKYLVNLTATDQSFNTKTAKHWAKHELAVGLPSLNRLGICDPKIFSQQVRYMPLDMREIPNKLYNNYDFLWSNCALGHLGSIKAGLDFIEESLKCLKPGGWAVHTTEVNILSLRSTADNNPNVVVFRLIDLLRLQNRLIRKGYKVSIFNLTLGDTKEDRRISIAPKFGNDFSKIQVMGQLATQVVLLIHNPINKLSQKTKTLDLLRSYKAFFENTINLKKYVYSDRNIKELLSNQMSPISNFDIKPKTKKKLTIKLQQGVRKTIFVDYKNNSPVPLFDLYQRLSINSPTLLGTTRPHDRKSLFRDKTWPNSTRATSDLWVKGKTGVYKQADFIKPKQDFAFRLNLNAKKLKKGTYVENFGVILESKGWIPHSELGLEIEIL